MVAGHPLRGRDRPAGAGFGARRKWSEDYPALIVLVLAVVFTLGDVLRLFSFNWLPILLILIGLYLLFGSRWTTSARKDEKTKHGDDVV